MSRPCPADRVAIGSIRRGSAETPAYLLLAMDLWDCSARSLLNVRNKVLKVRRAHPSAAKLRVKTLGF